MSSRHKFNINKVEMNTKSRITMHFVINKINFIVDNIFGIIYLGFSPINICCFIFQIRHMYVLMHTQAILILRLIVATSFFCSKFLAIYFSLFFWRTQVFLWSHWYSYFGLLVMSPLGFKAKVCILIHTWQRYTWYTFLRFTSGATPSDVLMGS